MDEQEKLGRLRHLYEDLSDEDIIKAQQKIEYVLYDKNTGEIVQTGDMDMLAFEQFIPQSPDLEKMIVEPEKVWRLRGEFIDHKGDGKHMFKVQAGNLEAKAEHVDKIGELKLPRDKSDEEIEIIKASTKSEFGTVTQLNADIDNVQ